MSDIEDDLSVSAKDSDEETDDELDLEDDLEEDDEYKKLKFLKMMMKENKEKKRLLHQKRNYYILKMTKRMKTMIITYKSLMKKRIKIIYTIFTPNV